MPRTTRARAPVPSPGGAAQQCQVCEKKSLAVAALLRTKVLKKTEKLKTIAAQHAARGQAEPGELAALVGQQRRLMAELAKAVDAVSASRQVRVYLNCLVEHCPDAARALYRKWMKLAPDSADPRPDSGDLRADLADAFRQQAQPLRSAASASDCIQAQCARESAAVGQFAASVHFDMLAVVRQSMQLAQKRHELLAAAAAADSPEVRALNAQSAQVADSVRAYAEQLLGSQQEQALMDCTTTKCQGAARDMLRTMRRALPEPALNGADPDGMTPGQLKEALLSKTRSAMLASMRASP